MKILFYTDPHLREHGSFPPFNVRESNGLTRELNNIIKGFDFVADICKEKTVDYVICLGDLFHNIDSIPNSVLYGADIALSKISSIITKDRHYCITGNHDIVNQSNHVNSISCLRGHFTPISSSQSITLQKDKEKVVVGFIPYSDIGRVYSDMMSMRDNVDMICTHSECAGAVMESGHPVEAGVISKFGKPVFSGHIHLRQDVDDWKFPGSLVQHRFNRDNTLSIGGVIIYDTVSKSSEFIPNTYSKHYVVVRNIDTIPELHPDNCVLLTRLPIPRSEVEEILGGKYEFHYIPVPKSKSLTDSESVRFVNENISQDHLLKNFVYKNRPSAMDIVDKIISGD